MGQFIEALEKGANCLIMPAFGCRLGFYDILHKQVLEDLGYEFEMLTLFDYTASANRLFTSLSGYNPELTREKFNEVLSFVAKIVMDMDWMSDYMRRNAAFEVNKGEFERTYQKYLAGKEPLDRKAFTEIKINKPEKPIRIGLVGDLYTVIEPHGNCEIVKWLIGNGVEVVSKFDLTYLAATMFNIPALIEKSGGYVDYNIGGSANNNIALAYYKTSQATMMSHSCT
jgi:predicted nucleotide-binding protein (sugar kinase/HSP70/actin superfamily)